MDFVSDSLVNGRRLKLLTVADDFSHECIDVAVDHGMGGQYVTRLLDHAARFRGYPQAVRTDNGPEFTSRAFMSWAQAKGVRHLLIEPGKPMQNPFIESFTASCVTSALTSSGLKRCSKRVQRLPSGAATTTSAPAQQPAVLDPA